MGHADMSDGNKVQIVKATNEHKSVGEDPETCWIPQGTRGAIPPPPAQNYDHGCSAKSKKK